MKATSSNTKRSFLLDFLKGIAIIAVILYHAGLFQYGYLGVDIFLVIGGYLITKSYLKKQNQSDYNDLVFIKERLVRLWPLLIITTLVSLMIGWFVMLPDYLKNTAETAIGSVSFTNNFVDYITSSNYWDGNNDFKPLMHTWYVGLLMQFYVIFPLLLFINRKLSIPHKKPTQHLFLWLILIISLCLYVFPICSDAAKFYLLPSRMFEFVAGILIALYATNRLNNLKSVMSIVLLLLLCFVNADLSCSQIRLLLTVATTSVLLIASENSKQVEAHISKNIIFICVVRLGVMSYSLYLWHQVILAFYRCCFRFDFGVSDYVILFLASIILGWISYILIERGLTNKLAKYHYGQVVALIACIALIVPIAFVGIQIWKHQGVVRNIPELDIVKAEPNMNISYNDRISTMYDHDFPNNGLHNILVVGDSYARDWTNVLLESGMTGHYNLSWHKEIDDVLWQRSRKADIIFLANNGEYTRYTDLLPLWCSKSLYRIGDKYFGNMGAAYIARRMNINYAYTPHPEAIQMRDRERKVFGDKYIDIEGSVTQKDGTINLFTPEGKFITHDGLHLTQPGARYISKILHGVIERCLR